jgi:transposase
VINSTIADVMMKEQLREAVTYGIIDRSIESKIDWASINSLGVIGVDKISLKKGHGDYVTIVTCRHEKKPQLLALSKEREKAK